MSTLGSRIEALDWPEIEASLDSSGFALIDKCLSEKECEALISTYDRDNAFRATVNMSRHNFGSGEYRYFSRPLPDVVEGLRRELYPHLAPVANRWSAWLGLPEYPRAYEDFLTQCSANGQTRPTPLLLRYGPGDYNCLHQDLYGDVVFPLQLTCLLNDDFQGGEFLLVEQRPRAQSRGHVIPLHSGQAVIFATRYRAVRGSRGYYRANLRHGVSDVRSGRRYTLGVIFHDAR
ncbi:MAG: 2OG-Fe(II) oxygenase [Chloroflexi bacterium]|nr:2OG-Fe(II) oxygenase [Chloroflexota bacterium]